MRFLLLQARNPGDEAAAHEQQAFSEVLDLGPGELTPWDLLQGPPPWDQVDAHDSVLVGGSGEYGLADVEHAVWLRQFVDFCGEVANRRSPMFASCFGFQALVVAGGGRVEPDKSRAEVGTFQLSLTPEGRSDPLFQGLPTTFPAQFGHKDHALDMPQGMTNLASTRRSPHQALRVDGAPIYGTQFHPELSMEKNRERYTRYLEAYSQPDMIDPPETVFANFRPTLEATSLLQRFVTEILAPLL